MINYIWAFFIVSGIIYSIITNNFSVINTEILECGKTTLDLILKLFPMISLWTGIVTIAKKSGLLDKFSKLISPLLSKIFKDIPPSHPALGYIASNIAVNMFGLGSAATPLGLKAMSELQKLNKNKKEASSSMITFLVMNTSGLTIIPTTVISLRMLHGSSNPTEIVITSIIATLISTIAGLLADYYFRKKGK